MHPIMKTTGCAYETERAGETGALLQKQRARCALNSGNCGIYNWWHGLDQSAACRPRPNWKQCMRILASVCFGLFVAAAALSAAAQPFVQGQGQGRGPGPAPRRGADQPVPQGDRRGSPDGDHGRMNSDERRQLRRDIQDAGKDLYHPARTAPDPRRSGRR